MASMKVIGRPPFNVAVCDDNLGRGESSRSLSDAQRARSRPAQ